MINLYLSLTLTFIILTCTISVASVVEKRDGELDSEGLDDGCEVDANGIVRCESNADLDTVRIFELTCTDNDLSCSSWASMGECEKNPNYMLQNCMKSCNNCPVEESDHSRLDNHYYRQAIQEYGVKQQVSEERRAAILSNIKESVLYMRDYVYAENPTHNMSRQVIDSCENKHMLCAYWAILGECDANPGWMATNCAPVCQSCEKIDMNSRCGTRDPNMRPGLHHGELNELFERIVQGAPGNQTEESQIAALEGRVHADGTPYYTVNVHSRPASKSPLRDEPTGLIAVDSERDLKEDPWIITMDNFLTKKETDHLIDLGYKKGYERSKDVGAVTFDGSFGAKESESRTSANAWCDKTCQLDPTVQRIIQRLENVTKIPSVNFEDFQMLKYEVGEFYKVHHDYIIHQKDRLCGPRILTFFLYLSDVDEGGGTSFKDLGIVVSPKKGRALLWPSVMNYDPSVKDGRTSHEALTVEKGTKFAANAWIHLYDYQAAHKIGCT